MNIKTAISEGVNLLSNNLIKCPGLDSEILLAEVLNKKREFLILNLNEKIEEKNFRIYKDLIKQRSLGKPIAYLTKKKNFWNSEFKLSLIHISDPTRQAEISYAV